MSSDNPSIHSKDGESSSGGAASNLNLELDENYFSDSTEMMSFQSTEEIETAIEKCKENILSLPEMSEEKRILVQRLVQLRLRLQDFRDLELYSDPKKVKVIQNHKFTTQTVQLKISTQSTQLHCDACARIIWMPVQHWFSCSECGYIAHAYCLTSVRRKCAAVMAIENPTYILKICPEKSLEHQKYSCAECSAGISYSTALCQPHLCDYTGQYYCKDCHWSSLRVIPARVLLNWDLEPRPVSRASKQFLKLMEKKPIINVESINPHLFNFVEELAIIKKLRMDILVMKEYILSCKDAMESKLLRLLEDRQHFVENWQQYSLQDLIDAASKDLINYLQPIHERFSSHITRECLRCRGKGHVCRLCDQPPIIFPFEISATLCNTCHSVYHRTCLNKRDAVCLKCQTKGPTHSK